MMKQKTAVEWLVEQWDNWDLSIKELFEQAKQIEREQIAEAYDEAKVEGMCLAGNPEYKHLQGIEYYKQTYSK